MDFKPSDILKKLQPLEAVGHNSRLRYAFLGGTSSSFLISELLFQHLSSQAPLPAKLQEQIEIEIKRIQSLGFGFLGFGSSSTPPEKKTESFHEISLHLAHGCNLACTYCNVQQGTYGEKKSLMDEQTALAAIDFLAASISSGGKERPTLALYGGEPLLNWPVLEAAVHKMKATFQKSDIKIVTNGTLLNQERAEFLAQNDIFTIISIDGPQEIHDHNRPTTGNNPSYNRALAGLEHLKKAGAEFHIRGTWVPGQGLYEEVLDYLAKIAGDRRLVTLALCFEAVDTAAEYDHSLKNLFKAAQKDIRLFPSVAFSYLDHILQPGLPSPGTCGAGSSGFSVTPSGEMYPCQVSVSLKKYRAGNVYHGLDEAGQKNLENFSNISDSRCQDCWARVYCPGPCPYAVPFAEDWSHCKTVKLQIRASLDFCAATPPATLLEHYGSSSPGPLLVKGHKRVLALRELLWKNNQHIKPLAICPSGRSDSQSKP